MMALICFHYRKEVSDLSARNSKLQEQVEVLEARIEQRHMQVSLLCLLFD